jgi:Terminase small subunit
MDTRHQRHTSTAKVLKTRGVGASIALHQAAPAGTQNRARHGLTAKQEAFAQAVSNGLTLADAYRAAYQASGMKDATVWSEASRLMSNPRVAARIDQLIRAKEQETLHDVVRMRRLVIERLHREALHAETASGRIRALELLGKLDIVGLFKPSASDQITEPLTASQLEDQIRLRLAHFSSGT